jgi:hypothetical protein
MTTITADKLYALTGYTVGDFSDVADYISSTLLREAGLDFTALGLNPHNFKPAGVEVRIIKEQIFDHKNYWRLGSIWYEGTPVAIFQRAGRFGFGHERRYVTALDRFRDMCIAIHSEAFTAKCWEELADDVAEVTVSDVHNPDLTKFYGSWLELP